LRTTKYKACTKCRLLVSSDVTICPNCRSTSFSTDWSGLIVVFNPEKSEVAKILKIAKPGRYVIKTR